MRALLASEPRLHNWSQASANQGTTQRNKESPNGRAALPALK